MPADSAPEGCKRHAGRCTGAVLAASCLLAAAVANAADDGTAPGRAELERRVLDLEQELRELKQAIQGQPSAASTTNQSASTATDPASHAASAPAARLRVHGDMRVRGQADQAGGGVRNRQSAQVRGRLGVAYAVNDIVSVGARLATGDPDDPNSTDVQLSSFVDDLQVGLDLAFVKFDLGDLTLHAGKLPQPFSRTDLVWDSDVNPQGVSASYRRRFAPDSTFRVASLFFIVDEQAAAADSTMVGIQFGVDSSPARDWKYDLSAGYYDYRLGSVAGADTGDFRSNLRDPDGNYVSDFDLLDVLGSLTWSGLGERWPARLSADYVRNLGAEVSGDTGYGIDLTVGRAGRRHDWRAGYGYTIAETDAVLAAFSHDNLGLATNYRLHAATLDYVPSPGMLLTATWYHYQSLSAPQLGAGGDDWMDRFRLAFLVSF